VTWMARKQAAVHVQPPRRERRAAGRRMTVWATTWVVAVALLVSISRMYCLMEPRQNEKHGCTSSWHARKGKRFRTFQEMTHTYVAHRMHGTQ